MAAVFISYNRESKAIATTLAADIATLGHTAWFDQEISGGRTWWDQILSQVRECDIFIFILDPQALVSVACKREYAYAADLGKSILPVLVSDQVSADLLPPALSQIQFVDYRVADRQAGFRLARALNTIPASAPLPEPLPPPPEAPISYLGSLTERIESLSPLTYEDQSVLVADLRRTLRDVESREHAPRLLEALRKRRDLYAVFAEEVDDLLRNVKEATPAPSSSNQHQPQLPQASLDNPAFESLGSVTDWTSEKVKSAWPRILTPETRFGTAVRAVILGYVFYVIIITIAGTYKFLENSLLTVAGFALAGAVAGKNKRANLAAVGVVTVAAALGVGAWLLTGGYFVLLMSLVGGPWVAAVVAIIFVVREKGSAFKQ